MRVTPRPGISVQPKKTKLVGRRRGDSLYANLIISGGDGQSHPEWKKMGGLPVGLPELSYDQTSFF